MADPPGKNFYYLSPEDTREHIESSITFLEAPMKNSPSSKKGDRQSRYLMKAKAKHENVKKDFYTSNLHDWVDCDHCGACRCVYFNKNVGKKDGPRKED